MEPRRFNTELDRTSMVWFDGGWFFASIGFFQVSPNVMLGANCDNRYLYSIRSNRLSLGAEHWVGNSEER